MTFTESDFPQVPRYVQPPPTNEKLDYADLAVIDLAKAVTPEGRAALVAEVRDAMVKSGFFYVVNHGYTPRQTARIFDIADVPFSHVSLEEKRLYQGVERETGVYQGYKLPRCWHIDGGVLDQVEHYSLDRTLTKCPHPRALQPFLPEIEAFTRHNHFNILFPILELLALGLELPEDTFVKMHGYDSVSSTSTRFMKYYPRSEDEEAKTRNVWLKGHTDYGTITVLWSQPVSGLQVMTADGRWKWVKHMDNALVINAGDALEFLSGGLYGATIHRVVQPPPDQRNCDRLGVFYFCRTDDNIKLAPLGESPVLQRIGIRKRFEEDRAPLMEEWHKGRTISYGVVPLMPGTEQGVEEEVINGVVVKHYN